MFRALKVMRRRTITAARRADRGRQEQAPARDAAPPPEPVAQLTELDELREQGILTQEEVAAEKRKLLGI